jgi:hypothetical protein
MSLSDETNPKPKRKRRKDNRAGKRPVHVRRARKGGVPGKPTFEPSEDQKFMVAAMAGMRMSIEEMRLGIRNSYTGAALSKPTFMRLLNTK